MIDSSRLHTDADSRQWKKAADLSLSFGTLCTMQEENAGSGEVKLQLTREL